MVSKSLRELVAWVVGLREELVNMSTSQSWSRRSISRRTKPLAWESALQTAWAKLPLLRLRGK